MRENFAAVMRSVLRSEGGFVDHPSDPGGATNLGITRATLAAWRGRQVSKQEIRDLAQAEALEIYRARYWTPTHGDLLPGGVDLVVMDAAVNSGVVRAIKWLQLAIGVTADGKLGPATLAALRARNAVELVKAYQARRLGFLRLLPAWATFGRGWRARVDRVELLARVMAAASDKRAANDNPRNLAARAA